jgi:hypothetical protein
VATDIPIGSDADVMQIYDGNNGAARSKVRCFRG